MADISDVFTEIEAFDHARNQFARLIKEVLPDRKIILADEDYTVPTQEYISLQTLRDMNLNGLYSEKPRSYTIDVTGKETYIYDHIVYFQLRTFKGDAFKDMKVVKTSLRNKRLHQKYFSDDGRVGLVSVGEVNYNPTIMDDQSIEKGANLTVSLSYIFKNVQEGGDTIDEISYTVSAKDEEGEVIVSANDTITD